MFITYIANNEAPSSALMPLLLCGISRESRSMCLSLVQNQWESGFLMRDIGDPGPGSPKRLCCQYWPVYSGDCSDCLVAAM